VRAFLNLALAAVIGLATYYAVDQVAEHRADRLAGGETYPLDERRGEERLALGSLLERLARWDRPELAGSLAALEREGRLWVAPRLAGGRSAIYVDVLHLVRRIYVRRDDLLTRELPFPGLGAPDSARRTFAALGLAGTLFHELQHYEGLEDERATYDREIAWYRGLRDAAFYGRLAGEDKRWVDWAIDSAVTSALAARDEATGSVSPPPRS
jgi:hypothetical protein